ncbi:MAG: site-specific integrase [Bacilli bacterium]|jgi:integrase|nr:site-specific integrase [Bacilli bacterium]
MGRAVSVSRHWVKFLKRYNAILDYERVFAFKKDVPAPHVYHFYTIGQFRVFMSAIASPRDRLLFGVLFYYGLRISEALALKGSDFKGGWLSVSRGLNAKNSEGHQIITTPKTSSSIRRLPPVPQVQALLKEYPHGDGFLFPSAFYRHRLLGQTEVDRLRKRYAEAAGLPAIKNHEFRDSCSVALISHGVSTRYVSRWLGHASEATTQKYYADLLPDEKTVISDFWATDPKDLSFNKQK